MHQILIVDDLPENLKTLSSIVQSAGAGYIVRVANNGLQALRAVEGEPPDVILLDILMPGMDGYAVCQQLKHNPRFASIPVIFISALDEMTDKLRAFEVGGVDYIGKPFQAQDVLVRIETQLKIKDLQERLREELENQEQVNQQLAEVNRQLEVLLKEREEILGIMAHDLKNILAAMTLKMHVVKRLLPELSSGQGAQMLDQIIEAKDQMVSIITRLLDVTELENGVIDVQPEKIILEDSIAGILEQYRNLASAKMIALNYERDLDSAQVYTDPTLFEEVLSNLVSNAIKYSPQNTTVIVRSSKDDYWVKIEIQDQGLGLSEEDQAKLFVKFARLSAKPTGGEKSLGLGLYIVKKLTDALGGRIEVYSPGINQGSIFCVCLPLHQ